LSGRGGGCDIFRRRDSFGQHSVGRRVTAARRAVGRARAAKLALLGEPFSGIIAGDLGIATLVVPETDLDEASRKLVDKLANGPTKAYAAARTLLKAWSAGGIAAADVMMLDVAIDLFGTEDTTKGILNSAKAIEAGVQPSPLTFLGR